MTNGAMSHRTYADKIFDVMKCCRAQSVSAPALSLSEISIYGQHQRLSARAVSAAHHQRAHAHAARNGDRYAADEALVRRRFYRRVYEDISIASLARRSTITIAAAADALRLKPSGRSIMPHIVVR